jgi:hypothetical protein
MKAHFFLSFFPAFVAPLSGQTITEWALSDTSPNPDIDITENLAGTLTSPSVGDGRTSNDTDGKALVGRFDAPVTLASPGDSITVAFDFIARGGASGFATNSDVRFGVFNSNGTNFSGNEADLTGWTGALSWNSAGTTDADIRIRQRDQQEPFYTGNGTVDITGNFDQANSEFQGDGVIYTLSTTIIRRAGNVMETQVEILGEDGYRFSQSPLVGQETTHAEFTFDRFGIWLNTLNAERFAIKASDLPESSDGDSIPDLRELYWFGDLATANDNSDTDGDGVNDLQEITIEGSDPTFNAPALLFVDFNSDGSGTQIGPVNAGGFFSFAAPHESRLTATDEGMDFPIESGMVNVTLAYTDDLEEKVNYSDTIKQMIGRSDNQVENYVGTHSELIRDWVGIDPRFFEGGNGPENNIFGSPTNLALRISGLPAGDFTYRALHHDVDTVQGAFELFVTDANRSDVSVGEFEMTSSLGILPGNTVYDVTGNRGVQGTEGFSFDFAEGGALPQGDDTRTFYAAELGGQVVDDGRLRVYIDDLPAVVSGLGSDRTWYSGIAYQSGSSDRFIYVDATLANTDNAGGGTDASWASGDDGSTGGTVTDGATGSDGLWAFRSDVGNGGLWEASGENALEDAPEIVTTVDLPNGSYSVLAFFLETERDGGDYPIRAGHQSGPAGEPGVNPGAGNSPLDLPSTLSVPFTSDGVNPVEFVYKVFAAGNDPNLSIVGINGFQVFPPMPKVPLEITAIERDGNTLTLAWTPNRDERYDIEASTDLDTFDNILEDIPSQANDNGQTSTFSFPLPSEFIDEPKVFFRIAEQ